MRCPMRSDIHGCLARQGLCIPGDSLCKVAIQAFWLGKNDDDIRAARELKAKSQKNLDELLSMANCELNRVKANIARQDMKIQETLDEQNKEIIQKVAAQPPKRQEGGQACTTD